MFISLISAFLCFGQDITPEDLNFKLDDDKKVTWQKVYESGIESDSLTKVLEAFLKNNFFTTKLTLIENRFVGQSAKVKLSSTKGVAIGAYQPYFAFIKIDVRNNKYRVTVADIIFDGTEIGVSSGGFSMSSATPITMEDFVVRNNKDEFRKNRTTFKFLSIVNKDLTNYFTIKKDTSKDDW